MPTVDAKSSARTDGRRHRAGAKRPVQLLLGAMAASLAETTSACTYVEVPYPDEANEGKTSYMIARTMEIGNVAGRTTYDIEVVPASVTGGRFGYLAPMSILELSGKQLKIPFEGMNEKGLTVSALFFSEGVYEEPGDDDERNLSFASVVSTLLSTCESVDAALDLLASVRVIRPALFPEGGGHWAITDPSGRSVVVEYLQGRRVVLENTPRVMTNDPDLEWQWRNLNTYSNLSPFFPEQNSFLSVDTAVGPVPRPVGHGWNLFGLPGDFSPPSRFVRMFFLRGYALHTSPPEDEADAVVLGTALLNNVFIPKGVVAANPHNVLEGPEYTPYAVLKSPQAKKMLFRGYRNLRWREIDLNRLDFTKARSWLLEDGTLGISDITESGEFSTAVEQAVPSFV